MDVDYDQFILFTQSVFNRCPELDLLLIYMNKVLNTKLDQYCNDPLVDGISASFAAWKSDTEWIRQVCSPASAFYLTHVAIPNAIRDITRHCDSASDRLPIFGNCLFKGDRVLDETKSDYQIVVFPVAQNVNLYH